MESKIFYQNIKYKKILNLKLKISKNSRKQDVHPWYYDVWCLFGWFISSKRCADWQTDRRTFAFLELLSQLKRHNNHIIHTPFNWPDSRGHKRVRLFNKTQLSISCSSLRCWLLINTNWWGVFPGVITIYIINCNELTKMPG